MMSTGIKHNLDFKAGIVMSKMWYVTYLYWQLEPSYSGVHRQMALLTHVPPFKHPPGQFSV